MRVYQSWPCAHPPPSLQPSFVPVNVWTKLHFHSKLDVSSFFWTEHPCIILLRETKAIKEGQKNTSNYLRLIFSLSKKGPIFTQLINSPRTWFIHPFSTSLSDKLALIVWVPATLSLHFPYIHSHSLNFDNLFIIYGVCFLSSCLN